MMELTICALILTLISFVTATPYGYGVKGGAGASSRAESSAIAGSFGNPVPLAVPLGSAYSGSFSKSSSSSSSLSSASSSSSSSSFSYNGSGGESFSRPETNGNAGCISGICQNAGHQGPIGASADFNGYNIANSAAVAGSEGTAGVNCKGPHCNGNGGKCSSGHCQPTEASITGYDPGNKCSSGQCGPTSPSGHAGSQYDDSDDIHFVPHSSKVAHDSKNHSFNDKTTGYTAGSDCPHGNCGPSGINAQPTVPHGSPNSYPANSYFGVTPGSNLPATHLETPNPNFGCNSGTCQIGHDNLPTSYNVPIHGSSLGCNTPGCSSDFSSPGTNPELQYDSKKEVGSKKELPIYTGGFGGPPGMLKPNEFNIPISNPNPTHNTPSISAPACTTPNCIGSPTIAVSGTSTTAQSGSYSGSIIPSNNKPIYTGGFGGPAGMLKPNEFNIPISNPNPTQTTPSISALACTTPNCIGSPTIAVSGTSTTAQSGSYSGGITPSNNKPIYTGGFGGPPGMLKPDEYDIKVPLHSSTPSYNNHSPKLSAECTTPNCKGYATKPILEPSSKHQPPVYTGGFGGPPGVLNPNVVNVPYSTPNTHTFSVGDTTPPTSFGVSKPITVQNPSFSGSTNNYRPIGITYPSAPAVAPITPSYDITQPSTGISSPECKTRNCATYPSGPIVTGPVGSYGNPEACKGGICASYPVTSVNVNTPTENHGNSAICKTGNCAVPNAVPSKPHDITYPSNSLKPSIPLYAGAPHDTVVPSANAQSGYDLKSKEQLPVYTGGFGGPPGLLKPNDYSKPVVTLTPNKPLPDLSIPATCSSGICKPNEVLSPSSEHNIGLTGAHAITASSANAVVYTGGFGGPPGFLTPYDNGKVDLTKVTDVLKHGTHYSGQNALDTDVTVPVGTQSNTGSLSGSVVGTTAVSGATASANSGTFGYHNQGNGVKGGSPCGGGCSDGHQKGLQNSGSYAATAARSLSSSGAHGVGGSYASSAASAQSSAGAYTKGGYGKR